MKNKMMIVLMCLVASPAQAVEVQMTDIVRSVKSFRKAIGNKTTKALFLSSCAEYVDTCQWLTKDANKGVIISAKTTRDRAGDMMLGIGVIDSRNSKILSHSLAMMPEYPFVEMSVADLRDHFPATKMFSFPGRGPIFILSDQDNVRAYIDLGAKMGGQTTHTLGAVNCASEIAAAIAGEGRVCAAK